MLEKGATNKAKMNFVVLEWNQRYHYKLMVFNIYADIQKYRCMYMRGLVRIHIFPSSLCCEGLEAMTPVAVRTPCSQIDQWNTQEIPEINPTESKTPVWNLRSLRQRRSF